jgi:hypothetical protein
VLSTSTAAASFTNCDDGQINTITGAVLSIGPWLGATQQDLQRMREGGDSSRFEYWFGPVTEDKLSYLEALLYAVYAGAIENAHHICPPTFYCRSTNDVAWTEHGSALADSPTYGVYVCETFFGVTLEQQAAGLLHEYTHLYGAEDFTDDEKGDSGDWQEVARRLAVNNPDHAIQVAYNIQFYVSGK